MKKENRQKGLLVNIEIPIYRVVVNLAIHDNCKKALKLHKQLKKAFYDGYDDWHETLGAYMHSGEKNLHCIVLSSDAEIDTISHECFHCVMNVLNLKGINYSEDSEECFAYVLGFLTQKVYSFKKEYEKT